MSVTPNEIAIYGSASMPEADGLLVGGAIDFTKRPAFFDMNSTDTLDIVSSSASDTGTKVLVQGRDSTGTIVTPASSTLNGTTLIPATFGGQTFERLLAGVTSNGSIGGITVAGTTGVGDVAVMQTTRLIGNHTAQVGSANKTGTTPPLFKLAAGDGTAVGAQIFNGLQLIVYIKTGTGAGQLRMISVPYTAGAYGTDIVAINRDWGVVPDATSTYDIAFGFLFDILPNPVRAISRMFSTSQADVPGGSSRTYYEKVFAVNTNAATAMTTASIEVASETPVLPGSSALDIGLENTLNGTGVATNRQTLPVVSGTLTFVVQPSFINIPASPGSLPPGNSAAVAQGIWFRLTLPAGTTVYKGAADVRAQGATT